MAYNLFISNIQSATFNTPMINSNFQNFKVKCYSITDGNNINVIILNKD
jgi:hypothetical protein